MEQEKSNLSKSEREAFATVGRIGGKANFKKNGRKHMSEIGRKAAQARWGKKSGYRPKKI